MLRGGKKMRIEVHIGKLPSDDELAGQPPEPEPVQQNRLGLQVAPVNERERSELELDEGVGVMVREVEPGPAQIAGIRSGDVIVMINNATVRGVSDFERLVKEMPTGKPVAVLVQRSSGPMFLALRLPEG